MSTQAVPRRFPWLRPSRRLWCGHLASRRLERFILTQKFKRKQVIRLTTPDMGYQSLYEKNVLLIFQIV